jgi:XTP/dITP diphosphohydrolase
MELVVATSNPHKIEEIDAIFREIGLQGVRLLTLKEAAGDAVIPVPAETGSTFEANARIKAKAYAAALRRHCLADDSGLEVDVLGGEPGVISSHYCTDGREEGMPRAERDRRNNERLLKELEDVPLEAREARFVCVMAIAAWDGHAARIVLDVRGTCPGRIGLPGDVPRGEHGFGYDPLFLVPPDYTRASSELSMDEKNAISHRGEAARFLGQLLSAGVVSL